MEARPVRVDRSARYDGRDAVNPPQQPGSPEYEHRSGQRPEPRVRRNVGPETLALARSVLEIERRGLGQIEPLLESSSFASAIECLHQCEGRIQVCGVGKSGIVARRIASSFRSTATPAVFLHPTEAMHGDLGLVESGDVGLFLSKSGESDELLRLLPIFQRLGLPVIAVVARADNTLARGATLTLELGAIEEAGPIKLIPTTSTTLFQVVGDILVTCLYSLRGVSERDLSFLHPGGVIGHQVTQTVGEVMASGGGLPRVDESSPVREALVEMIEKRLGMTTVVNAEGRLIGVVTDGDVRRAVFAHPNLDGLTASEIMTAGVRTIEKEASLATAVAYMESNEPSPITSLVVLNEDGHPEGVIHLHDCLRSRS